MSYRGISGPARCPALLFMGAPTPNTAATGVSGSQVHNSIRFRHRVNTPFAASAGSQPPCCHHNALAGRKIRSGRWTGRQSYIRVAPGLSRSGRRLRQLTSPKSREIGETVPEGACTDQYRGDAFDKAQAKRPRGSRGPELIFPGAQAIVTEGQFPYGVC